MPDEYPTPNEPMVDCITDLAIHYAPRETCRRLLEVMEAIIRQSKRRCLGNADAMDRIERLEECDLNALKGRLS
jgi:hypothetical protein